MKAITAELLRATPLPSHAGDDDKDQRGQVLVIGGSREVPGAVLLAAIGALRAGAGKLQIATVAAIASHMGLAVPEALVIPLPETADGAIAPEAIDMLARRMKRARAILLGPGMMDPDATSALTAAVLAAMPEDATAVLDAGALHNLAEHAGALAAHRGRIVITPHAGEMASLLGLDRDEVARDPLAAARQAAARLQCVVAMKGGATHVVSPEGDAWLFTGGTVGLATSGSGDTLAGVIAGLLARGTAPLLATQWGVFLHGEAGRRLMRHHGGIGFLARELLAEIPAIMAETGNSPASLSEGRGRE